MLYIMITTMFITVYNFLLLTYIGQRIDRVNTRVDFIEFLVKLYNERK